MIKGKYIGTIELNFNINENTPGLIPFEKIKEAVTGSRINFAIAGALSEEFGDLCDIGVTKQFATLYKEGSECD